MLCCTITCCDVDDVLAAFTLPHNPASPPLVTPHHSAKRPVGPPHLSSSSSSSSSSSHQAGQATTTQASASSMHSSIAKGAQRWQENLRLAQEGLTLLRIILNDASLGKLLHQPTHNMRQCMHCFTTPECSFTQQMSVHPNKQLDGGSSKSACAHAGRAAIDSLVMSTSSIRLSLIVSTRLSHWAEEEACTRSNTNALPLPVQPWVSSWGSSNGQVKVVNGYNGCRGNLVCSSVHDVAHMAKSLRTRLLLKLNRMNA